ncbi:MAG: heparinase II/III family protein, partial [Armatimonadota bacterium]|nr:heparinase II/III family protein [Armatimonadota bacterium]
FYTTSIGQTEVLVKQPEFADLGVAEIAKGPLTSDRQFFDALNLDFPGLEAVKQAVAQGNLEQAKAAYLEFRRTRSQAKWRVDPAQKPDKATKEIDAAAEKVLQHLYGFPYSGNSQEYPLGADIDWTFNPIPKSDPSFTNEWTYITLNRMHQWETLGTAYWNTLNEKYAQEWVAQLMDWVQDNPVPMSQGPGSTLTWRTIEAGIRMAGSWPTSYYRFLHSPSFTPEAHMMYTKSVLEHAQRLKKVTLDDPNRTGNWVTMECNGMGTAGILFPEFKESPSFVQIAFDRLSKELATQVYPDGAQIELTSNYHVVALTNFRDLAKTAKMNNVPVPDDYMRRLKSMYVFNLKMIDQSGVMPPVNDSGPTRVTDLLKEAHELWGDPEFLFGATLGKQGQAPPTSNALEYAGYYTMRSGWNPTDKYLLFDAGPVGSGHWHEDMLNLYLHAFGRTLLTEPGSYMYDKSKWRNYVLRTPAHNTILVDGREQHRGDHAAVPAMKPTGNPWLTTPLFDYAAGTYDQGYQASEYVAREYMPVQYVGDKDTSVQHTRHVIFLKPHYFITVDFLTGQGEHRYDAHFHLDAPGAEVNDQTKAVHTTRADNVQLGLYPLDLDGLQVKVVKGQEDPVLGWIPTEKRPIPTVVYTKQRPVPATFSTLLFPYTGDKPEVAVTDIHTGQKNLWAKRIETPYELADVIVQKQPGAKVLVPTESPLLSTDARCVVVRQPKAQPQDSRKGWVGVYDAREMAAQGLQLKSNTPVSLVVGSTGDGKFLLFNPQEQPLSLSLTQPAVRTIQLAPQAWTEVTAAKDTLLTQPPTIFPTRSESFKGPNYQAYLQSHQSKPKLTTKQIIVIQAEEMELSEGINKKVKVAAQGEAIYGWDAPGQKIQKTITVPEAGFYRVLVRYATPQPADRSIAINDHVPFKEALSIPFASTQGDPPSDGWSNQTNDWRLKVLGEPDTKGGWLFYLNQGANTITLTNEGGGLNVDSIALVPETITPDDALWPKS